jgi:hypothetical protein
MKRFATGLAALLATTLTIAAADIQGATPDLHPPSAAANTNEISYLEQLKTLLDQLTSESKSATAKGKKLAEDTGSWFKTDFQKIGDWEYKQVSLPLAEISSLEDRLNALGTERWNCFWVQPAGTNLHLLFKRPAVSYLHKLSQIDFMRLLSVGAGADSAE